MGFSREFLIANLAGKRTLRQMILQVNIKIAPMTEHLGAMRALKGFGLMQQHVPGHGVVDHFTAYFASLFLLSQMDHVSMFLQSNRARKRFATNLTDHTLPMGLL